MLPDTDKQKILRHVLRVCVAGLLSAHVINQEAELTYTDTNSQVSHTQQHASQSTRGFMCFIVHTTDCEEWPQGELQNPHMSLSFTTLFCLVSFL